ncbi:MAG: hypothetical protein NW205_12420 [Hyphomicrobiaceae bacterium]|nr:hypothetical protein [Hyphomicrobiaceae bacterium]
MSVSLADAATTAVRTSPLVTINDIEPAGTPLQRAAQRRIHRARRDLKNIEGATSFGRSVAAFLPELEPQCFAGIVRNYRRVLLIGDREAVGTVAGTARPMGAEITDPMPVIGAGAATFRAAATDAKERAERTTGRRFELLRPDASAERIRAIQELQVAVGLTPLPGVFLRGRHGEVSTITLVGDDGRLLASATTVGLANVGRRFSASAIIVGVAVAAEARGLGLGSGITGAALVEAHQGLGAEDVIAVVAPKNTIAFKTNARFGLLPRAEEQALYVELGDGA